MSKGIDLGDAAMGCLAPDRVPSPTIVQAVEQIAHLVGTKDELREAVAYLALQAWAYRKIANEDAALAVRNIETIVGEYRKRRP